MVLLSSPVESTSRTETASIHQLLAIPAYLHREGYLQEVYEVALALFWLETPAKVGADPHPACGNYGVCYIEETVMSNL